MEVSLQSFRTRFSYDSQKDLLGKGGFGDVYKAYDNEDQIFVALKIAHASADDKHNLINEIKRFKKLNHPNIIKHIEAYEVNTGGFDIHGRPIINHVGVLEYADKGTLADLLKNQNDFGSFGNFRSLMEDLATDIIDGLAYLHSQNIIHRDLKPTNILLFSEGDKLRAKITDFGIAKKADATAASTQLVGTVEYMAPEYFTTGNITKASDIWSLGVMLLEALTGTHPFGKTTQGLSNEQIIRNILSKDLQENLAHAPLKELLTRCLLREPQLRPQNAEELKGLMQSGGDEFSERTQIINPPKKLLPEQKTRSNRRKFLFIGLLMILFVCVSVLSYWIGKEKQRNITTNQQNKLWQVDTTMLPDKRSTIVNKTDVIIISEEDVEKTPDAQNSGQKADKAEKPKYQVYHCFYGWVRKTFSPGKEYFSGGKAKVEIIYSQNYASNIIEIKCPIDLDQQRVSELFSMHIKEYCIKETPQEDLPFLNVDDEFIFVAYPEPYQDVKKYRDEIFQNPIIVEICNKSILRNNF
jgi:serine/threonine protein kinase